MPAGNHPNSNRSDPPHIVILIPCLNEAQSIAQVVQDFKHELPEARVLVFDNGSTDHSAEIAAAAGAEVFSEKRQGKGSVVQTMFQTIEADLYVMVDGDDTYPAGRVRALIEPVLQDQADMSIGSRFQQESNSQFRWVNLLGNIFFQGLINFIFQTHLTDILSGYRCLSRRIVKRLPLFERGFEIEAELTVKSLERGSRLIEVPVDLRPRQEGSHSKIRIVQDGIKILATIFALFRDYKPLTFFGSVGLAFILSGLIPGLVAVAGYLETGLVTHFPSAILSVGMILTGLLCITIGLVLHTLDRRFREMEYLIGIYFDHISAKENKRE